MRSVILVAALIGMGAVGCSSDDEVGKACETSEDCAEGLQCIDQVCVSRPDSGIAATRLGCQLVCETLEDCGFSGEGFVGCKDTYCVECNTNADCESKPGRRKHCKSPVCVECTDDSHCEATVQKRCNVELGRCVRCKSNNDCYVDGKKIGTGRCRKEECYGCIGDLECRKAEDIGMRFFCVEQKCVDCITSDDCPLGTGETAVGTALCDENTHTCTGCVDDLHCSEANGLGDGVRACLPY